METCYTRDDSEDQGEKEKPFNIWCWFNCLFFIEININRFLPVI